MEEAQIDLAPLLKLLNNDEEGSKKEIDICVNLILSFITVWP